MRVLVTNDDGVSSVGLMALARAARDLGLEVVVAAPAWNSSGASAALTGVSEDGRLLFETWAQPDLPDVAFFSVQAAPAMIVRAGVRGAFGPQPDLVLSGINLGPNTGQAVLHSGTVGAALTAATHGCRAAAFSLAVARTPNFEAAAHIARHVIPQALKAAGPVVLNVNVPSAPARDLRGLRTAPLATFGAVQTTITDTGQGYVGISYAELDPDGEPDSDAGLLRAGWATLTALRPVCANADVDLAGIVDTFDHNSTLLPPP